MSDDAAAVAADLLRRAEGARRFMVALAGPPGAGKSTFAEGLMQALDATAPGTAVLVPMDGYHLDNEVLGMRGLLARKGAPETFDAAGLVADLGRIRRGEEVAVPVFDRGLDLARAGARVVGASHRLVLVEGNYLLLEQPPWTALGAVFDRTLFLSVPEPELRRRLIDRWLQHGLDEAAAIARTEGNDLANARLVLRCSRRADVRIAPRVIPTAAGGSL